MRMESFIECGMGKAAREREKKNTEWESEGRNAWQHLIGNILCFMYRGSEQTSRVDFDDAFSYIYT